MKPTPEKLPTPEQIKRKVEWDNAISHFLLVKAGFHETVWEDNNAK